MDGIGWTKTVYDSKVGFRRVGLNIQEQADLMQAIRTMHVRMLRDSIEDAKEILSWSRRTTLGHVVQVAVALFERRAPATYSVYQEALGRKVHLLKNGNNGNGG